jgi:hypothetical protein
LVDGRTRRAWGASSTQHSLAYRQSSHLASREAAGSLPPSAIPHAWLKSAARIE